MKNKKLLLIICAAVILIAVVAVVAVAVIVTRDNGGETTGSFDSPTGYTPVISATKNILLGSDYVYFTGIQNGIFKYNYQSGEVSEFCTDPMCKHSGSGGTCRIANYWKGLFFKAFPDLLIYSAPLDTAQNSQLTNHMFCFDAVAMTNTLLDSNASTTNIYCMSNRYAYYTNVVPKNNINYFNHKQVDIKTGEIRIFGEETEGVTPYNLIGAINGILYATDSERTATYICSEDTPGEFTKFWDKPIANLWVGENDLFFKSRAPEDETPKEEAKYYFFHTDLDGNVLAKRELVGGMRWGSIYDGRYLYYIPDEDIVVENLDGNFIKIHSRELYRLDMETGVRKVAFTFDGDYATMAIKLGFRNDMLVYDNKIFTAYITEATSMKDPKTDKIIYGGKGIHCTDGIAIIDMSNGDITYVTANYSRRGGEMTSNVEHIPMDIKGE